ncbi:hypothetical protein ACGFX8_38085 [Streptomyces sp. NPDC048362]|uniref:hypothetical protein n=1 Tax=Streptomyces sp. NPDC048362 TaxID=3365539 RepID=UPI003723B316
MNKAHARLRHPIKQGTTHFKTCRISRKNTLQPDLAHHSTKPLPTPENHRRKYSCSTQSVLYRPQQLRRAPLTDDFKMLFGFALSS